MADNKYCYPNSNVLKNKLNITNKKYLFEAEVQLTSIRLQELQMNPLKGNYDFDHFKRIHYYIFQDLYNWAGKERTVEIGKGNLFCTTSCLQSYANTVFNKYFPQCYNSKDNYDDFIRILADNYGDVNALHPFREGNGRTQREFARIVCLACGYDFNLSCTTHEEMLKASILSFDKYDSSGFIKIFSKAIVPLNENFKQSCNLAILTSDDLSIGQESSYSNYDYKEHKYSETYNKLYKAKIRKMAIEKVISDLTIDLEQEDKKKPKQNQAEQNNYDVKVQTIGFDDFEK